MAQLVVAAAGAAVGFVAGGPEGAKIGWLAGSAISGAFGPKTPDAHVEGSRLSDLKVTGTEYGQCIPWTRGNPRLAGQLVWASERRQIAHTSSTTTGGGGGKGGGGGGGGQTTVTTTYTYDVDLLILLTDNEIAGIPRIWENGKLIYNASGDPDTVDASNNTPRWDRITVYTGAADQLPDPTYEAAVGSANALAYRGRGCVFIESLHLGESGAIPNLTFEVSTAFSASGGTITEVGGYTIHTFTTSGTLTCSGSLPLGAEALLVGGGGGGSGGGGAGGEVLPLPAVALSGAMAVVVGDGGTGVDFHSVGTSGGSSSFAGYTALGGSYGGGLNLAAADGVNGGGGGMSTVGGSTLIPGGDGTAYDGGNGISYPGFSTSGGGGAGAGEDGGDAGGNAGAGGDGVSSSISGAPLYYGGGGGGLAGLIGQSGGAGGLGGGGGGGFSGAVGSPGTDGLGGGGGNENDGGSGVVIIRYPTPVITGITLADVVGDLCLRAGLSAAQFDTSALTAITKPVRALAVSQVAPTRAELESLMATHYFGLTCSDKIYWRPRGSAAVATILYADLGASRGGGNVEPLALKQATDIELPAQIAVTYANVDNDYQTDTQLSDRLVTAVTNTVQTMQIALGFTAAEAKGIADTAALDQQVALISTSIALLGDYARLEPTDVVNVTAQDSSVFRLRLLKRTDDYPLLSFDAVLDDASVLIGEGITNVDYTPSTVVAALPGTLTA